MRVTVFGGTGPAGLLVIERALAAGHEVVAFARSPAKVPTRMGLTVVQGELNDVAAMERALKGSRAVISLLGPGPKVVRGELSSGVQRMLDVAKAQGVERVIVLATPSAAAPEDRRDWLFGALVLSVKLGLRAAYDEIVAIGEAVRSSPLNWTLVRVPLLINGGPTGQVRAGFLGTGVVRARLTRSDLAQFFVDQLDDSRWSRSAPAISN